jgi:hypothetical protein
MSLYRSIAFLEISANASISPLTLLRSSNLITDLTILIDLALIREITIVLPLLDLVLLVLT